MADNWLVVDVETVAIDGYADFVEAAEAPSNYKDPVKIAEYVKAETEKRANKAALDLDLARIVCLGWCNVSGWLCSIATTEDDEREMLKDFAARFSGHQMITFAGYGYDLPLLARRYLYLGLPVPFGLMNHDVYRTNHVDLWWLLSQRGKGSAHKLSWYAKRLGWQDVLNRDPLEAGGAAVAKALSEGRTQDIADHNGCDLELTKRLARWMGVIP